MKGRGGRSWLLVSGRRWSPITCSRVYDVGFVCFPGFVGCEDNMRGPGRMKRHRDITGKIDGQPVGSLPAEDCRKHTHHVSHTLSGQGSDDRTSQPSVSIPSLLSTPPPPLSLLLPSAPSLLSLPFLPLSPFSLAPSALPLYPYKLILTSTNQFTGVTDISILCIRIFNAMHESSQYNMEFQVLRGPCS